MRERDESTNLIGCYSNFLVVAHNAFEFVLDFGQHYEANTAEHMHTRIVTAPVYAKAMLETLRGAIERFESAHGPIPHPSDADEKLPDSH